MRVRVPKSIMQLWDIAYGLGEIAFCVGLLLLGFIAMARCSDEELHHGVKVKH